MISQLTSILLSILLLTGCERNNNNEWADIDYAKIARDNYRRENDSGYVAPPSVIGCVDDDLYNCRNRSY